MAEISIRGVELLQNRMQKAQESLKDVDENIKKLTGRSPGEFRGGRRGRGGPIGRPAASRGADDRVDGRARLFSVARRSIGGPSGVIARGIDRRRSTGQRYKRDSDDEDFGKPVSGVSSFVRQSVVEVPSREETISKQLMDKKGMARNKRMFGLLLGTLQKFKADTTQGDKTKKRLEIEEKLEQKAKEEKAEIYRQKQELWDTRRKKTRELRQLEAKLALVENHQLWEKETLKMKNFIRTETKPYIFWLPKDHVPETLRKHASSKKALDTLIEERKQEMEKDIEALLDEQADDRVHDDDDDEDEAHSDAELPKKDRRHSSRHEGSDLDEAMEDADPDMTVSEADGVNTNKQSGEKTMEANVKDSSAHPAESKDTDALESRDETIDMVPIESEEMHMETSEALTGQPPPTRALKTELVASDSTDFTGDNTANSAEMKSDQHFVKDEEQS